MLTEKDLVWHYLYNLVQLLDRIFAGAIRGYRAIFTAFVRLVIYWCLGHCSRVRTRSVFSWIVGSCRVGLGR